MKKVLHVSLVAILTIFVAGFASMVYRPPAAASVISKKQPLISLDSQTGEYYTDLSVLTYNVADLPWPVSWGRDDELVAIKDELAVLQQARTAPDIILVQEAFTDRGYNIGKGAGYPYIVRGPLSADDAEELSKLNHKTFLEGRELIKGELSGKFIGSGLAAFSNYQIFNHISKPFKSGACGGYDCLANKGMLMVRVVIPGVPVPIDIVTTHLNSRGSSGVPIERSLFAHQRQVDELADFVRRYHNPNHVFLLAGDLNVRRSNERLEYLQAEFKQTFTRAYCEQKRTCQGNNTRWQDHQDHQSFASAPSVRILPIHAEEIFDQPVGKRMLSDHNGYLVVYRIFWH